MILSNWPYSPAGRDAAHIGGEISGWVAVAEHNLRHIEHGLPHVARNWRSAEPHWNWELNHPPEYARRVAEELAAITAAPFVTAPNKFERWRPVLRVGTGAWRIKRIWRPR